MQKPLTPPLVAVPTHRAMTGVEWSLLLALSVIWGGSFLFIGVAVQELPPILVVFLRVALGAAVLYAYARLRGSSVPTAPRIWGSFAVMGTFNNVIPFVLIAWAQTRIDAGTASILNATTPLFGVMVAHFATTDERATPGKVAGIVIGFFGVAVMLGPDAVSGLGSDLWAELAVIGASLCYGLSGVYGRRFSRMGLAPEVAATGQLATAAVVLLPLTLIVDRPWMLEVPSLQVWAAMTGLIVVSTGLGYLMFYRLLATAGATNLMLVTLLIPPSAILLGVLFLDERVTLAELLGLALIALGLAAIDGRLWRKLRGERLESRAGA